MFTAHVRVAADRSAQLTVAGDTSTHPDLGSAMVQLSQHAKASGTSITAHIDDHDTRRTILVDPSGRMHAAPAEDDTPAEPSGEATTTAFKGADSSEHSDTSSGAGVSTHTDTPSEAGPLDHSRAPARSGNSAELSTSGATEFAGGAAPETASTAAADQDESQSHAGPASTSGEDLHSRQHTETPTLATPFSGPAAPTGPASSRRSSRLDERRGSSKRSDSVATSAGSRPRPSRRIRRGGMTVPGIVLTVLLVGALIAYFLPTIIGSPTTGGPENISSEQSQTEQTSIHVRNATDPVPAYSPEPAWQSRVPQTASVTATARGVLIIDSDHLSVLNPSDGSERYTGTIDGHLDFAVDTMIEGRRALLWRTGNKAQALFDGTSDPVDYTLPDGARLSSAGSSVLIKSGNSLSTFAASGLKNIPTPPPGSTPMALDDDTLISAEFNGPLIITDTTTQQSRRVPLERPADGLEIVRWVSAGHGKVITLWGQPGASTNSGHRIQLVVSDASSGKIASTVSTSTDAVGEASWVRGQNYEYAVIGPYLFDMSTGLLIRDGSEADIRFSEPRGTITPATVNGDSCLLKGDTCWKTQTNLLAVSDSSPGIAVVRAGADRVVGYPKD